MNVHIFLCTWHASSFVCWTWWKRLWLNGGSLIFVSLERTRVRRSTSGIDALVVVSCFLSLFFWCTSCVFEAPAGRLWSCVVFWVPRVSFARLFQRRVSSGHFAGRFSVFLRALYGIVKLWEARSAPFWHRGPTRVHFCASWRRQTTNSAATRATKSDFPPFSAVGFGSLFF